MGEAMDRKVFPMGTFYSFLTGEDMDANKQGIKELLGFLLQQDVDSTSAMFAGALAKAWIYEQNPELAQIKKAGKLGDHVSVPPLPEDVTTKVTELVEAITAAQAENADLKTKLADAEKKLADTSAKLKDASAKVKTFEAKLGEGEAKIEVSSKKVDDYIKKVDDLLAKIEEVKKHGVVTAAPGAEGAAAGGDAGAAQDTPGEVADSFGFGTDSSEDSFGF